MRAVIQRVSSAKVIVDGQLVSEIGRGLCVLVGIEVNDGDEDLKFIARKILNTKFFEEDGKRWMKSVKDLNLEVLCVSQFTLYHRFKGNKLDFSKAMGGEKAKEMYDKLLATLGKDYDPSKIKDGVFGALMDVQIHNDGPVTIQIESNKSKNVNEDDKE